MVGNSVPRGRAGVRLISSKPFATPAGQLMAAAPFSLARDYLQQSAVKSWIARLSAVAAAVCVVAFLPLLYLFVDLIDSNGRVATYAALPTAKQSAFHKEWERDWQNKPEIAENLQRLKVPTLPDRPSTADWEIRRSLAVHSYLNSHVGTEAAEAYFPLEQLASGGPQAARTDELGLLGTVARERGRWMGRLLASVASALPWTWQPDGAASANFAFLVGLTVLALVLATVRGLCLNLNAYMATAAVLDAATKIRREVYNHSQRLSSVAFRRNEQEQVGLLVSTRSDAIQDGLAASLTGGLRGPILIVLLTIVLVLVNTWLTIALLSAAFAVWLIAGQAAAYFRRDARISERRATARLSAMRESFSTMQLSKSYLMERFSQTRFERQLNEHSRAVWKQLRGETFSKPTLYSVVAFFGIVLAFLAGLVVLAGELSVAGLVVKAAAIAMLVLAVNRWLKARTAMNQANEAAGEVFAFLDRRGDNVQSVNAEFLQPPEKRIEFVDVSLREAGSGRMLLEKVGFTIPVGTRAAIYADDPETYTALAHLLTRFVDPTAGEIRFDGKTTRWVTIESMRTQVALVLESSLTFSDTVACNIGCGEPGFTLPHIVEAAKTAHAHQFVQRLPSGYETMIGAGGTSLKLGERFRIALARAILRDPSVIVIEEPADSLDAESLILIDDTLARIQTDRTIILLARRPTTAQTVDQVIRIRAGRLAEPEAAGAKRG